MRELATLVTTACLLGTAAWLGAGCAGHLDIQGIGDVEITVE